MTSCRTVGVVAVAVSAISGHGLEWQYSRICPKEGLIIVWIKFIAQYYNAYMHDAYLKDFQTLTKWTSSIAINPICPISIRSLNILEGDPLLLKNFSGVVYII